MLKIEDLKVHFFTDTGIAKAVDGASFTVDRSEIVGLVGESGCGKTVAAMSVLGIVHHPGRIVGGRILLDGEDLTQQSQRYMETIRGSRIGTVFQDPMTALNPAIRVGEQVAEVIRAHDGRSGLAGSLGLLGSTRRNSSAWSKAVTSLEEVGIPAAERRASDFAHQFSGGLRQRIVVAASIVTEPELLIADEPTTALDVTVQAQILDLLLRLKEAHNTGILLITHDLGVVAQVCDRAAVMYAGHAVENGPVGALLAEPLHPYTRALLKCMPSGLATGELPEQIPGSPPNPLNMPVGCRFRPRCPQARQECDQLQQCRTVEGRMVRCMLYD